MLKVTSLPLVSRIADWSAGIGAMPAEMSSVFPVPHCNVPPANVMLGAAAFSGRVPAANWSTPAASVVPPA